MPTYSDLLDTVGDMIVYKSKQNLKRKLKIASGDLYDSIKYRVEKNKLAFEMKTYGKWVDEGRKKGTYVPPDSLNKWLKLKGIDLKFSFVINRSIKENGIRPTWFFTEAYEDMMNDFDDQIENYVSGLMESIGFDN